MATGLDNLGIIPTYTLFDLRRRSVCCLRLSSRKYYLEPISSLHLVMSMVPVVYLVYGLSVDGGAWRATPAYLIRKSTIV